MIICRLEKLKADIDMEEPERYIDHVRKLLNKDKQLPFPKRKEKGDISG